MHDSQKTLLPSYSYVASLNSHLISETTERLICRYLIRYLKSHDSDQRRPHSRSPGFVYGRPGAIFLPGLRFSPTFDKLSHSNKSYIQMTIFSDHQRRWQIPGPNPHLWISCTSVWGILNLTKCRRNIFKHMECMTCLNSTPKAH